MAMESILKELEARIETLVDAYRKATARSEELEHKLNALQAETEELRGTLASSSEAAARVSELENQRDALATRLEKVVGLIDGVLDDGATD